MPNHLILASAPPLQRLGIADVPILFGDAGDFVSQRFVEFFTAEHRNQNTRAAYAHAVRQFTAWAESQGFRLEDLTPVHVAAYVEQLGRQLAAPSCAGPNSGRSCCRIKAV
jgi:site-specific recombinase XerD